MRELPFPRFEAGLAVVAILVLILAAGVRESSAQDAAADSWATRGEVAAWIANFRPGTVSYAVVDADGQQVAGYRSDNRVSAASTIKAMILAAYLRQPDVADRALSDPEKASMTAMITWSSNDDATRLLQQAGWPAMESLAAAAGMQGGFFPDHDSWGLTQITASSMAKYFHELPALIPPAHRDFALGLFADVVPGQQWGMPRATPAGWAWHVKGGWISEVVNQVGTFTRMGQEFTVAVTIEGEPGPGAGVSADPDAVPATRTVQLVTAALFGDGSIPGGSAAEQIECSSATPVAYGAQVEPGWAAQDCDHAAES